MFFTGCEEKDYSIAFDKNMILDYKSEDTPLSLIKKVGNKKITSKDIKGGKVKVDNLIITCDKIDTNIKGQFEIKYYTNDVDQKEIRKTVKVSDISQPEIKFNKGQVSIYASQVDTFNVLDYFSVSDNDDQDPTVKMELDRPMNGPGEYVITVTAVDSSENKNTKTMKITVNDDPIPIIEQTPADQNNPDTSSGEETSKKEDKKTADKKNQSGSNQSKSNENKQETPKQDSGKTGQSSKNPSQYNRFFAGDTITVYEEAYAYANRIFATGQVNVYSVEPTGTGYQVTFS